MNNIQLLDEDFPWRAKSVRFIQEAYDESIKALGIANGLNSILFGCEIVGPIVTAGAVVLDGEVLILESQTLETYIKVEETVENETYKGGVIRPTYYTRKAILSDTGTITFASLAKSLNTRISLLEASNAKIQNNFTDTVINNVIATTFLPILQVAATKAGIATFMIDLSAFVDIAGDEGILTLNFYVDGNLRATRAISIIPGKYNSNTCIFQYAVAIGDVLEVQGGMDSNTCNIYNSSATILSIT